MSWYPCAWMTTCPVPNLTPLRTICSWLPSSKPKETSSKVRPKPKASAVSRVPRGLRQRLRHPIFTSRRIPISLNLSECLRRPKTRRPQRGIEGRHQSCDGQPQSGLSVGGEILPAVPDGTHHDSGQRNRAAIATQVQTMNLQIPEERRPKRCSQNQTGSRQTCRLRHDEINHLSWTHSHGHQHAELTRALDDRHEHGVDDTHDRQQEENEKENKSDTTIELDVVVQLRRQLRPGPHPDRKGFTQLRLQRRRRRRRRGDVMELDPNFMDPPRRQAQQLLQRSERHEHQTPVHVVKPRVKRPGDRVQIISRGTICRR